MNVFSLCRVELGRLFHDRRNWPLLALAVLSPGLGFGLYAPTSGSLSSTYLANPALAGALGGGLCFALLAAWGLERPVASGVETLSRAMVSPLADAVSSTAALALAALPVSLLAALLWLPVTAWRLGAVFSLGLYAAVYLVVMLPALWLSGLFAAAMHQISRRLDVTLIACAGFFLLSLTAWAENWLLRWVNPPLFFLSDDFGNLRRLLSLGWNRLFWLLALGGGWLFSLLCVRRYGKGVLSSFSRNARTFYLPLLALALAGTAALSYVFQPFVDHSKEEIDYEAHNTFSVNEAVIYSSISVDARPDFAWGRFFATAVYTLQNTSGQPQTISFWVNPGYDFQSVTANGAPVPFRDLGDDDLNEKTIEVDIPAGEFLELAIEYGGLPQEWNIMALAQGEVEVSRDSIYLANQDFSPLPRDFADSREDGVPFTAEIVLPNGLTPVLFGQGVAEAAEVGADSTRWLLRNTGWNIILYAGDYVSEFITAANLDVEFYYSEKHRGVMEAFGVADTLKQVMEYCTEHFGPLSFYRDGKFRLLEIGTVGGGYAGGGASVMSEDSFSEAGLQDPLKGAGGSEVMAHEIIHQWWGLGNMIQPESAADPWSSEGLTVYTTYRLMKELYGADYAQTFYVDLWRARVDGYYQNFYVRNPEFLNRLPERYQADISNSLSGVRQYCETPLKILKAEQLLGGEAAMDKILSGLFTGETNPSYPYLTWEDFLNACGLAEEELRLD